MQRGQTGSRSNRPLKAAIGYDRALFRSMTLQSPCFERTKLIELERLIANYAESAALRVTSGCEPHTKRYCFVCRTVPHGDARW